MVLTAATNDTVSGQFCPERRSEHCSRKASSHRCGNAADTDGDIHGEQHRSTACCRYFHISEVVNLTAGAYFDLMRPSQGGLSHERSQIVPMNVPNPDAMGNLQLSHFWWVQPMIISVIAPCFCLITHLRFAAMRDRKVEPTRWRTVM